MKLEGGGHGYVKRNESGGWEMSKEMFSNPNQPPYTPKPEIPLGPSC